jgi:hypothetical protein
MENLLRFSEGRIGYPPEQGERLVPGRVPDRAVTTLPPFANWPSWVCVETRNHLRRFSNTESWLVFRNFGVPARANDPSAAWSSEKSVLNYDRLAVNDGLCGIIEGPRYF